MGRTALNIDRAGTRRKDPGPFIVGILNVTPDSFSDGGDFLDPEAAAEHAAAMVDEGADVLDVGGESTRPGSDPVSQEEEIRRVVPVLERILSVRPEAVISVDTYRAGTATAARAAVDIALTALDPKFFEAQPPSYRKMMAWWVVSAKQEETRRRRLEKLKAASASAKRL